MNRINNFSIWSLMMLAILFSSCNSSQNDQSSAQDDEELIVSNLSEDQVQEVYKGYLEIKDAFVNSDEEMAKQKANELISKFKGSTDDLLNDIL